MIVVGAILLIGTWIGVIAAHALVCKTKKEIKSNFSVEEYFMMQEASDKVEILLNELGIKTMEDIEE